MSITDVIVRILCVVAVVMAIVVIAAIAYSWLGPVIFLSWMVLFVLVAGIVLYKSIHFLEAGQMISFHLFGSKWLGTVVTKAYYDENRDAICRVDGNDKVTTGSVAFGLWPFYWGYRLPATTFEIPIRASSMYTRAGQPGKETLPRIRLCGDGTLQLRLHPVFKLLPSVLPVLSRLTTNLAKIVPLEDVPPGPDGETLKGPVIANSINGVIKKPVLQAMRTAAALFTWGNKDAEKTDIVDCRDRYELEIQRVLLQPGSVFITAGFLMDPEKDTKDGGIGIRRDPARWSTYVARIGLTLIEIDVVVELIKPEPTPENASDLEKAIDLAYIGQQEGAREGAREQAKEKLRLFGQAEGYKEMARKLGITENKIQLVLLDAVRKGEVKVTAIGGSGAEGLVGLLEGLIGKAKP